MFDLRFSLMASNLSKTKIVQYHGNDRLTLECCLSLVKHR